MRHSTIALCLLVIAVIVHVGTAVSCVNAKGEKVDWWIMLKYPQIDASDIPAVKAGFGYQYLDSNNPSFAMGSQGLDANQDALAATLQPMYGGSSSVAWAHYNDENTPGAPRKPKKFEEEGETTEEEVTARRPRSNTGGHTKGVVTYDHSGGFWLVHSIPRFPPLASNGYAFPEDEKDYGQSLFCMTMDISELGFVGTALQYNDPEFQENNIPSSMQNVVPTITQAVGGTRIQPSGWFAKDTTTSGGQRIIIFAKNGAWNQELYEDLVAPSLNSDLTAETWIRSPALPSWCKPQYKYNVVNAKQITVLNGVTWTETKDHSKWAVAQSGSWTCIGDINRMSSQAARGGGTICLEHTSVHSQFAAAVTNTDSC